jgi:hypothetical protein
MRQPQIDCLSPQKRTLALNIFIADGLLHTIFAAYERPTHGHYLVRRAGDAVMRMPVWMIWHYQPDHPRNARSLRMFESEQEAIAAYNMLCNGADPETVRTMQFGEREANGEAIPLPTYGRRRR